jgi:hypothetical protein
MKKLLAILILAVGAVFAQPTNYPGSGTAGDPWQISTVAGFDSLRWNSEPLPALSTYWWILTEDIDFEGVEYWQPISHQSVSTSQPWLGSIDGNGKTLKNLTIDTTVTTAADLYIGLFANTGQGDGGETDDGIKLIHNIKIDNFHINIDGNSGTRNLYYGIFSGLSSGNVGNNDVEIDSVTITNSSLTVDCPATTVGAGIARIGGLSGGLYRAHHLYVDVDIIVNLVTINPRAFQEGLGGIAGTTSDDIKYSAFVGTIVSTAGGFPTGGIVGYPYPVSAADTLSNCYVISDRIESVYYTGGLIGLNQDRSVTRVANCYTQIDTLHAIQEQATDFDGYLIGYTEVTGPVWTTNYVDTQNVAWGYQWNEVDAYDVWERTLASDNEAGTAGREFAKTTEEMQTQGTYVDWNFADIWKINGARNDGYPELQWVNLVPLGPILDYPQDAGLVFREDSTISIQWTAGLDTPLTSSELYYSLNGGVDWVSIVEPGILAVDYSWTIPSDVATTQGKIRIVEVGNMEEQRDSSANDFTILAESSLNIYYPIEKSGVTIQVDDTLHIDIESSFIENIWLYWSNDSTAWSFMDSTAIDTVNGHILDSTTYVWTFDETVSGPEVWVWVTEQGDTTLYGFERNNVDLGTRYPQGLSQCQTDSGGTLIEFFIHYDPSCGWTQPPHTYYNSRIGDLGESYDVVGTVFDHPYAGADFPRSTPVHVFTGVDTVDVYLNQFYDQYGATVTYKNRFYYVANQTLYCNDLVNGIDSIVVSDLSDQYTMSYPWIEGEEILQVYHVQRSKISGFAWESNTVWETLNDAWFDPLILISATSTFPARTITVEALDYPANDNPAEDIQKVLTGSSFQRYHFRGIHPKIRKE